MGRRWIGRARMPVAMLALLSGSLALFEASAAAGPSGGTSVKVDGVDLDGDVSNAPHQTCALRVEFFGFADDPGSGRIDLDAQAPTRRAGADQTVATVTDIPLGGDPAGGGGDLAASVVVSLHDALTGIEPHPEHGVHLRLSVTAPFGRNDSVKHKDLWVVCAQTGDGADGGGDGDGVVPPGDGEGDEVVPPGDGEGEGDGVAPPDDGVGDGDGDGVAPPGDGVPPDDGVGDGDGDGVAPPGDGVGGGDGVVPPGGGDGVGDGGGVLPPDDGVVPPADGVGDGDGVAPPGDGATDGEVGGDGATDGDAADQVGGDGDSGAVVPAVDGGDAGLTGGDVGNGPTAGDGTSGAAPAEPGGGSTPATDAPTDVSSPCWFTAPATSGGPARSSLTCGDGASPSTPWPNDAMAMPANAASVSTPTGENVAGVRTSARRDSRGVAVTRLPRTGHDVAHLALFGAALVAAGGALLLMRGGTAQGAAPGSGAPLTSARVLPFGGVLVVTHPHARIRELRRMPIG